MSGVAGYSRGKTAPSYGSLTLLGNGRRRCYFFFSFFFSCPPPSTCSPARPGLQSRPGVAAGTTTVRFWAVIRAPSPYTKTRALQYRLRPEEIPNRDLTWPRRTRWVALINSIVAGYVASRLFVSWLRSTHMAYVPSQTPRGGTRRPKEKKKPHPG